MNLISYRILIYGQMIHERQVDHDYQASFRCDIHRIFSCFPVTPDSECLVKLIPLSTLGETEHSNDEPGSDPKSVSPCRHRRGHRAPWGGNADIAELNLKGIWLLLGLLDLDCSGIIRGVTLKKLKSFG
uniref:Uncharacterized protein n=1 Tax=Amorphochlora amoebiformis TaxID=1561963 RepID=A0A7S0DPU3_9EUKA|mmetsp:Transcript_35018/g.56524  ORF Transcript_35018/g.56524 Transcript_35018/m.56524 type:complete len:129 (+) Transcript_35018:91-477(+)